jgi:hypothetical protein
MFFKNNVNSNFASLRLECPGISCKYTCQESSADKKATEKIAEEENKASVRNSASSPVSG